MLTFSLVSCTVKELEYVSIISSSFFANSFLFSGLFRTCIDNHSIQKVEDEETEQIPMAYVVALYKKVRRVPFPALGAILMDKSGRRPLIMISASGTFLGCFIIKIAFFLKGQGLLLEWVPTLTVAGVLIYITAFAIGMGQVPCVIMYEACIIRF
ncbi:hypothetical protein RIF29_20040 [Crotalaria pallida]|uniref:Uncharacterized protein n=1 Tax=Crotalaria pallida TaxID=3830 RepID=A0AAN9I732_CROPI